MSERTTKDVICMRCGKKTRVPASARLSPSKNGSQATCSVWYEGTDTYCGGRLRLLREDEKEPRKRKPMTKSQLIREVAYLISEHNVRIYFGKGAYLLVGVAWRGAMSADVREVDFICKDSTKLEPGDWSKIHTFNARIRAACDRSDELAAEEKKPVTKSWKREFFNAILLQAENKNAGV